MRHGYERGFHAGLANDARAFGDAVAAPAGQEWVRRFVEKDARQSSFLTILPPADFLAGRDADPISKKAPGDRALSFEEIGRIAALIGERSAEGKVSALPAQALDDALADLREHLAQHAAAGVAVRSSSPEEDLATASWAGMYATHLGVGLEDLEDAVRSCFASCFDARVVAYR